MITSIEQLDPNKKYTYADYTYNQGGKYVGSRPYAADAGIPSQVLTGLEIKAGEVFEWI